jgi:hypothetical protein
MGLHVLQLHLDSAFWEDNPNARNRGIVKIGGIRYYIMKRAASDQVGRWS